MNKIKEKTLFPSEEERLAAIKLRKVKKFNTVRCNNCKRNFTQENMWKVVRYGPSKIDVSYYYCQQCMPTREAILRIIDTDEIPYGIYNVDPYPGFIKKRKTT